MERFDSVFSRIMEKYNVSLTDAEKRLADYILNNPHEAVMFSVSMLAEKATTSEATVVRFARSLGFRGFLELKNELLKRVRSELAHSERPVSRDPATRTILDFVVEVELGNLQRTVGENDETAFLAMATILNGASVIYTLGTGISSLLARLSAYQLTMIGRRSAPMQECIAAFERQLELANPVADVMWVFSFPPYTASVLGAVEFARSRGMRVVAVTDRHVSPVVTMADAVLYAANSNVLPLNSITSSTTLITALLAWLANEERRTEYAHHLADSVDKAMLTPQGDK
jgi:DNA-binding MurR/RpiR family transcriptional regulator